MTHNVFFKIALCIFDEFNFIPCRRLFCGKQNTIIMKKSFFSLSIVALGLTFGLSSCDELDDLVGLTLSPSIPIEEVLDFNDPSQGDSILMHQAKFHILDFSSETMPSDIKDNLDKMSMFKLNQVHIKFDDRVLLSATRYFLRGQLVLFEVPSDLSNVPSNMSSPTPIDFPSSLTEITTIPLRSTDWIINTEWTDLDNEGTFTLPLDPDFEEMIANHLMSEKKIGVAMLYQFIGNGPLEVKATVILDLEIRI